jgi:hypothetical protein
MKTSQKILKTVKKKSSKTLEKSKKSTKTSKSGMSLRSNSKAALLIIHTPNHNRKRYPAIHEIDNNAQAH